MATITCSASRTSVLRPDRFVAAPTIAIRMSVPEPRTLVDQLIAILDRPCAPYEGVEAGFARKEHELGALLSALEPAAARAMQFRLTACSGGDELAHKFARLSLERRARLLARLFTSCRRAVTP